MGRKGYSGVGLTEILTAAGVPKGSFYHYFASKDAFGEAMVAAYFEDYLAGMDAIIGRSGLTAAERLMLYFADWRENQVAYDCQGRCLAVKLGAEVADLSEPMRLALKAGTGGVVSRLEAMLRAGRSRRRFAPRAGCWRCPRPDRVPRLRQQKPRRA